MSARLLAGLGLLLGCGCGSVVNGDYLGAPTHLIHGTLTGSIAPASNVTRPRVAVVWAHGSAAGSARLAMETTELESLSTDFTLELFHEPAGNIFDASGKNISVSMGSYVAFEDLNGNDRLDIHGASLARGVDLTPDRIFGYSPSDFVFVLHQPLSPSTPLGAELLNPQALRIGWNDLRYCLPGPDALPVLEVMPEDFRPELKLVTPSPFISVDVGLFGVGYQPETLPPCG